MTFGAQHQLQTSQIAIYSTQLTIILVITGILQEFSVVGCHNCSCLFLVNKTLGLTSLHYTPRCSQNIEFSAVDLR